VKRNDGATEQLEADLGEPRAFESGSEVFGARSMIYVKDEDGLYTADPKKDPSARFIPRITVAERAIAVPDVTHNRIQLSLENASNHEVAKDVLTGIHTHSGHDEQILEAQASPELKAKGYTEMPTRRLIAVVRDAERSSAEYIESNIELQRRLTLPIACLTLALVGIPLGISTRKGGRSASYIMAIVLAFFCYYLGFITLTGLARQRSIGVVTAAWLPNIVFALVGRLPAAA